jgi:hypothetical protein
MNKDIVGYILSSIECWGENKKIGEEVRMLETNIVNQLINVDDSVLDAIYDLICKYPDDYDLGYQIRKVYIPLKFYMND